MRSLGLFGSRPSRWWQDPFAEILVMTYVYVRLLIISKQRILFCSSLLWTGSDVAHKYEVYWMSSFWHRCQAAKFLDVSCRKSNMTATHLDIISINRSFGLSTKVQMKRAAKHDSLPHVPKVRPVTRADSPYAGEAALVPDWNWIGNRPSARGYAALAPVVCSPDYADHRFTVHVLHTIHYRQQYQSPI